VPNDRKTTIDLIGKGIARAGFLFAAVAFAYDRYADRAAGRFEASIEIVEAYGNEGIRDLSKRLLYCAEGGLDPNAPEDFDCILRETPFGFDGVQSAPDSGPEPFPDGIFKIAADICRRCVLLERAELS